MQLSEPVKLRPHHVDLIDSWLNTSPGERPIYEQPENLLHFFGDKSNFYDEFFRYLSNNRHLRIEIVVGPSVICKNCPGYDSARDVCTRYYEGEDITSTPEELRKKKDRETIEHYDLNQLKTV